MSNNIVSPPPPLQFNNYKFIDLCGKLNQQLHGFSSHQKRIALDTVNDLCWTRSFDDITSLWQKQHQQPSCTFNCLSLLHFNIFHFYSNQADLVSIIQKYSPTIISLNELGTVVPTKTIKQLLFSYKVYAREGTNPHGGVILAVDKRWPSYQIEVDVDNIQSIPNLINVLIYFRQFKFTRFRRTINRSL